MAKSGVGYLSSAEEETNLHLVAFPDKLSGVFELGGQVVLANLESQSNLFNLDELLILFRLLKLLGLLVLVLAPVEYFGYWRLGGWGDFCKIISGGISGGEGLSEADDAKLLPVQSDKTDGRSSDFMIQADTIDAVISLSSCRILAKNRYSVK